MLDEEAVAASEKYDLNKWFPAQVQFCRRNLKVRGCMKPAECGNDVVTDYLPRMISKGRAIVSEDDIQLIFPAARNQEAVLRRFLLLQCKHKSTRCHDCRLHVPCHIVDDVEPDEEEHHSPVELTDPVTPYDLFLKKELWELFLEQIKDPRQREAFVARYEAGETTARIAERYDTNANTVRQWFSRGLAKLRDLLASPRTPDKKPSVVTRKPTASRKKQIGKRVTASPRQTRHSAVPPTTPDSHADFEAAARAANVQLTTHSTR